MASFLPLRWRMSKNIARHNEAISGILRTPPIKPKKDGLVLFSQIGSEQVLSYLVAVKSLSRQLQRGRIVLMDDGTLTAPDRTILAQHCGDPEILRADEVHCGSFPKDVGWEALLTVLDSRLGEYWIWLEPSTVTLGPLIEMEQAIASNRSQIMLGGADAPTRPLPLAAFSDRFYPDGPSENSVQAQVESRLGQLAQQAGWHYLRASSTLAGFAAGNAGRELAGAYLERWQALFGKDEKLNRVAVQCAAGFLLANEGATVCLPYSRYLHHKGEELYSEAALLNFPAEERFARNAYITACQRAIEELSN